MTEFALIVPVFMLIVVGMLIFGRLLFYWIETNHVASETARWAVVDRNPYGPGQTLQESARSRATNEFEDNAAVCIDYPGKDWDAANIEPGDPVRVRVQVPVSFVKFFGWGVTIKGSATMRVERVVDLTPLVPNDPIRPLANPNENIGTCS